MSVAIDHAVAARLEPVAAPAPPRRGLLRLLFGDVFSAVLTAGGIALALYVLPRLIDWAIVRAAFSGETGAACQGGGACWAFLRAKFRLILFGIYPPDEQWRPMLAITLILAVALWSLPPSHWGRRLVLLWGAAISGMVLLLAGGIFGLAPVPTSAWGGLPVTILLTVASLTIGFPFGVILALGRRSALPVPRMLSIAIIEVIRGLPLLSLLFVASILIPIFLPEGMTPDKLVRALAALTIFSAAYLAEVVRAGLQGVPDGQGEAARALGLSWFRTMQQVVLPQAIQKVIPPLTNTIIVMVKNTSLVLVVGLFDLLSAGRAALTDPSWPTPYVETYLFIALIYFAICFGISRYSRWLELQTFAAAARK